MDQAWLDEIRWLEDTGKTSGNLRLWLPQGCHNATLCEQRLPDDAFSTQWGFNGSVNTPVQGTSYMDRWIYELYKGHIRHIRSMKEVVQPLKKQIEL
jgi:hypothetical protein